MSSTAVRPSAVPLWVRVCMSGVPDRRTAMVYYWLFVVAACAFPVGTLLLSGGPSARQFLLALLGTAFSAFALWSTAKAVRWLDRWGWDTLL